MILSAPRGEFLKGFLYNENGRTNISIEDAATDNVLATLKIGKVPATRSEGGDYKPTSYEYCNNCCSVQPFYGSRCMNCSNWDEYLDEIIVTPECPEHGKGCTICFKFCKKCFRYNCNCDADDPYPRPEPPPGDGGGNGDNNGNYPELCPDCQASNCPGRYGQQCEIFPPMGGPGTAGGSTQQTIPFTFLDNESWAKVSGVILKIMNTTPGSRLIDNLKLMNISIKYDVNSNYFASYSTTNNTLTCGKNTNEAIIFHELVHALQDKNRVIFQSNRMNREVEAFVGMYKYADLIKNYDLLPGEKEGWFSVIGEYVNNPTEENYMAVIAFVIETNPSVYSDFSENPDHRNTNNIDFLFNGN